MSVVVIFRGDFTAGEILRMVEFGRAFLDGITDPFDDEEEPAAGSAITGSGWRLPDNAATSPRARVEVVS